MTQNYKNIFGAQHLVLAVALILAFVVAFSFQSVTEARNDTTRIPEEQLYVPGQFIVKFKDQSSPEASFLQQYNLKSAKKILSQYKFAGKAKKNMEAAGLNRLYVAELDSVSSFTGILRALNQDSRVEYAEPNYIVSALLQPNDPYFSQLWGMHNTGQTGGTADADIDAPEAWDIRTHTNLVIGVIDTGIDYTHKDLADNMWLNPGEIANNGIDDDGNGFIDDVYGWDFVNNDNDPFDDHGHGTHVAGTIGAKGDNGVGVAGVNWTAKVAALKFLSSGGSGTTAGAIEAVGYANMMGFKVTNNSWGGGGFSQALYDAISAANAAGNLFVAAAGNSGLDADKSPMYPAAYDLPNIISVAATDHNDLKASFSNYGLISVDLGAPGVDIYSTVPTGTCSLCDPSGYRYLSGTSMATPHVSGVAGLIRAQFPTLTSDGIKSRLLGGVDQIASLDGITVTGGRLNAYNSLEIDNIPPSAVTNLVASNPTLNSVTLTWTATGDDGNLGTANSYDVRYSTVPISEANWGLASKATGEPKPKSPGLMETFTVKELSFSTTYYFALKVIDNVGNASGLSNVVSETTKTPVIIFQDNMENGVNGWNYNGLWHQETYRFYSFTTSWAYNTGAPNYNYNTGAKNSGSLTSPILNLLNYKSALVDFWYWYETETTGTSWDQRWIQIGVNGSFTNKVQLSGDSMKQWNKYSLDLSSYAGKPNVQIRFFFDTIDSILNNYEGWYIDDVTLYGELAQPNNPPVANDQSVTTNEDTSVAIILTASDLDGDPLTFSIVSPSANGSLSGTPPNVSYTPNPNYNGLDSFTFKANDGKADSNIATVSITINPVNDPPLANAGPDQTALVGSPVNLAGSGSSDIDGTIVSYNWNFGDGATSTGITVSHVYSATGTYIVTLTVTDNGGLTATDTAQITVTATPVEVTVFKDSFEISEWNGLWTEDKQNDWFRSTQRAVDGKYSAEVDGLAADAKLTSIAIDLQGRTNATISFSWYIESGLDAGEYLAFDVSTNGGISWVEKAKLNGNVDPENTWHNASINLTGINSLKIQFRGKMSDATEDANVDMVKVVAR